MKTVDLYVSEAGRQRVLKTKQKNVHTGYKGTLISFVGRKSIPKFSLSKWMKEKKTIDFEIVTEYNSKLETASLSQIEKDLTDILNFLTN